MKDTFCTFMNRPRAPASKGLIIVAAILALAVLLVNPVAATPPTAIVLAYNDVAGQLNVTITHPVPNPDVHYIKNVMVKVNDDVVINRDYTSQPTKDTFTYTYAIPLLPGDTVRATATCVLTGSLTETLTIPAPVHAAASPTAAPTNAVPVPTPTPKAAAGLLPVTGAIILVLATKKGG
jgi:desulfoferrodoxin (superoxide reductase-like protein)